MVIFTWSLHTLENQESLEKFSFLLKLNETQEDIFHMTITQVGVSYNLKTA